MTSAFDELEKISMAGGLVGTPGLKARTTNPGRALGRGVGKVLRVATVPALAYGAYRLLKGNRPQPQSQIGVPQ